MTSLSDFDRGVLTGLLVGEGSFGGDGRQPQIVLRMHVRHERIFEWLRERFPATRLYGPYNHGGRHYYQWMARGRALVDEVLPELDPAAFAALDGPAAERLQEMCDRYAAFIADQRRRAALLASAPQPTDAAAGPTPDRAGTPPDEP